MWSTLVSLQRIIIYVNQGVWWNSHLYRLEESRVRQERSSKILINVKAGVEHLADKLQHLKAVRSAKLCCIGTIDKLLTCMVRNISGSRFFDREHSIKKTEHEGQ